MEKKTSTRKYNWVSFLRTTVELDRVRRKQGQRSYTEMYFRNLSVMVDVIRAGFDRAASSSGRNEIALTALEMALDGIRFARQEQADRAKKRSDEEAGNKIKPGGK